jgi:hypothetical protein
MDPALIISLLSGAAGGNAAGSLFKNLSLGLIGNSVAGILGGGIGGKVVAMLLPALAAKAGGGSLDIMSILSSVLSGGVGGGGLMALVGLIRSMLAK